MTLPNPNSRLILAVEDRPQLVINQFRFSSGLEEMGFTLHDEMPATQEDAIRLTKELNPGLILMDSDLDQEYSGLDVWKALREAGFEGVVLMNSQSGFAEFQYEVRRTSPGWNDPNFKLEFDVSKRSGDLRFVLSRLVEQGLV
ncbi:MAG: hypothetical protein WC045_01925 [Patescibacteria group bacterium]